MSTKISRREALKIMGVAGASAFIVACGKVAATMAPTTAPATAALAATATSAPVMAATATAAPKPVTLTFVNHWHEQADAHYKGLEYLYKAFQAKYPYITINSVDFPKDTDSNSKIQTDCAAGSCPDIIHVPNVAYDNSGWLLDLTPYVTGDWLARWLPGSLDMLKNQGHLFGLDTECSPLAVGWNKELIEGTLGSKVPTTWEEFLALGDAAKAKGLYLFSMPSWQGGDHFGNSIIFGTPGAADALGKGQWDNDGTRKALTMLKDLIGRKFNPANDLELDYSGAFNLVQQKKVLCFMDGSWTINNNITPQGKDQFGLSNSMAFTNFMKVQGNLGTTIRIYGGGDGLSAALKNDPAKLDAALKFMDFWTSTDVAAQWIALTSDPMGVQVANYPTGFDSLQQLMGTSTADVVYTDATTGNAAIQNHMWDHFTAPTQALQAGKSVDDAMKVYVDQMDKYAAGV